MSTDSPRPTSRFRTGRVSAPATPTERLERLLGDGEQLFALFDQLAVEALRAGAPDLVVEYARVAGRTDDAQRAYTVHRHAADLLMAGASAAPRDDQRAWARYYDHVVDLLVPVLERTPHEPELLNLLGAATYELGRTSVARRVFEAVRHIEPTHKRARGNLRACRERMQRGISVTPVPDAQAPALASLRPRIKRIAELASRLEDRTVSVCMIVKDEEEMLPGCLAAVAGHVDQIVVVDTGSTDRTKEIAAEHGALVLDFEWTGSFSDARNHSLEHCTGDWVLWLDADEHVVDDDAAKLRELARKTWVEGFHLIETHFTGDAEIGSQSSHTPMRMFQRRPGYSWKGTVHEQLLWAFPTWLAERFQHTPVRVDHFGYLASIVDDRSKHQRNLELLNAQVADGQRDAFTLFNIGTEHAAMHDWIEARTWFEEALQQARGELGWQENQFAPLMVQRTISARRSCGDAPGAIALADEALTWWPEYTDLVFEKAIVQIGIGDWSEAEASARQAIVMGDAPARFVSVSGKGSFQARAVLAAALRERGDVAGARRELEQAVEEAPNFLGTLMDLTDVLLLDDPADEVAARIDALLGDRAQGPAVNMIVGAAFHEAGEFGHADERYQRVLAAIPKHGGALVAQAELRLAQGEIRQAYDCALSVEESDMLASRSGRTAFLSAVVLEQPELLDAPLERITGAEDLPAAERAVYRAWRERIAPTQDGVATLVPADPAAGATVLVNLEALAKLGATDQYEQLYPLAVPAIPDEQSRRMQLAELYLRRRFADLAGEELMACADRFGASARVLTGLGKVATIKELWEDAEVLLSESLRLDPAQPEAERLLNAIRLRATG